MMMWWHFIFKKEKGQIWIWMQAAATSLTCSCGDSKCRTSRFRTVSHLASGQIKCCTCCQFGGLVRVNVRDHHRSHGCRDHSLSWVAFSEDMSSQNTFIIILSIMGLRTRTSLPSVIPLTRVYTVKSWGIWDQHDWHSPPTVILLPVNLSSPKCDSLLRVVTLT